MPQGWYQLGSACGQTEKSPYTFRDAWGNADSKRFLSGPRMARHCQAETAVSLSVLIVRQDSRLISVLGGVALTARDQITDMGDTSYLKDLILLRNDPSTVARIREAAERGEVDAQYAMGLVYAEGRGVEIDLAQAHYWLSLAIAQGDRDADVLRNIVGSQMTDAEHAAAKGLAAASRATHRASRTRH